MSNTRNRFSPEVRVCAIRMVIEHENEYASHVRILLKFNGVTRLGLTLDAFDQIFIPVPPLDEQVRIAEILSTWDEALEYLSHQINRKGNSTTHLRPSS